MILLKLENISTGYGKKQVLFDVSLNVDEGEVVVLFGNNGSGKSTLLKAIFGILPLWNRGKIVFDGQVISGRATDTLLQKGLLYIPQKNNLFEDLSVKENLEMAALSLPKGLFRQRLEIVLTSFPGLSQLLPRKAMKLSGGERQLLTLAMAFIHKPKMILLDEPLTGLSQESLALVVEAVSILNERDKITFLIVEHRVKESISLASRAIGFKLGAILDFYVINEKFDINNLNKVFV